MIDSTFKVFENAIDALFNDNCAAADGMMERAEELRGWRRERSRR